MKTSATTLFLVIFTFSLPAMGYIDPGSGSVLMSAIIGFFVAIAMAAKTYWYKLKSILFGKKKSTPSLPRTDQIKKEAE